MYQQNINKRDPWVKSLKQAYSPEDIAEILLKRISNPNLYGPFLNKTSGEEGTDVINLFIDTSEEYKKKIVPAIGLILYNLLYDKLKESHELLRGVFSIIARSKLNECSVLLRKWLVKKKEAIICDDIKWKTTYREAMIAYAYVQNKEEAIEKWWLNLWNDDIQFWWSPAFLGLRIQNSSFASTQIKKLIERRYDKAPYLLASMWKDDLSRKHFESSIALGLNTNDGWAGRALNMVIEKLSDDEKNELMCNLKKILYYA